MSVSTFPLFTLPNGITAFGFNEKDVLGVYRDIFDDHCYLQHGITIKDGDCVLDVGANIGLFILFLNKHGAKVKVYAFEPIPRTFQALSRNVEAHNQLPVEIFNVGLAQTAGKADFTFYPRFSQASSLFPNETLEGAVRDRQYIIDLIPTLYWPLCVPFRYNPRFMQHFVAERVRQYYLKKEMVTCELWNLSEFLRQKNVAKVDLLKVDAEQCEEEIIAGVADDDWPKIRQIIVEVHGGPEANARIIATLGQRGFRIATDPHPAFPTISFVYGVRPN